ncbi:hypothetical protein AB0M02_42705 [Actinoplanes sp. NPDC051861]|uniref:hypothetical protein n=1 Tax=Actinoplanes sp. NPDC051861 TaxID=3155170 RepID=UPI0034361143
MIQMIGGEMPEYAEERPPAGGDLYRHLLDRLPARTRVLVAGPHDDALIDALTPGLEVTCLVRSQPDAERLSARGVRVLCGTLPKLTETDRFDTVVALDGVGRLCSPEGPQYDWTESVRALKRTLRPGGTLLLTVGNELGVHRLVEPGTPTAARTGDAWRPLGEFGSAPGRPDRLAAVLGAEGLPVTGLAAIWPLPENPALLATPETLRYGPLDALAALAAAAVGSAYTSKVVLTDPRRIAAAAVRRGLGAELAPAWLAVAHLAPRPAVPFPLPPGLLTTSGDAGVTVAELAGGPDGWHRRVVRGTAALNGPLPAGRLLEELLLTAALGHDLPALRRLLTGWMAALPRTAAGNVLVDGDRFAVLDPSTAEVPDALGRFARTLLTGGYAHPWPGVTEADRMTEVLAGAAGLPDAPPPPEPTGAPDIRREHEEQLDALRRRLADATERNHFFEAELEKRDAELGRAKAQIAMFSGSLGYRAAKAGLVIARKALRKGKS